MPTPPSRRAWGTRFDSLVDQSSSRPPISSSPDVHSRDTTFSSIQHDQDATPTAAAEKERLSSNLEPDRVYPRSTSSGTGQGIDMSPSQARMPHDASVFVASLPSHVPDTELQANLSAYFSQHAAIKHVKLIRDNRGAVCAFVQVESAAQAANLIAACNLTQFMDRLIRCETARAFRTLLVSWRSSQNANSKMQEEIKDGNDAEKALRLRRCRGSRYVHIAHGADALPSDLVQLPNYSVPRSDDALSGTGVFFPQGIKDGDFETLESLLETFGPLEFVTPFEPNAAQQPPQYSSEPQTRDESTLTRGGSVSSVPNEEVKVEGEDNTSEGRQPKMWAAKWEHRNDAVSAITTLQHIPNLFVCWAHSYGRPLYMPYASGYAGSPRAHSRTSSGFYTQGSPSYPSTPYTQRYGRFDASVVQSNDGHPDTTDADVDPNAQWAVVHPPVGPRLQQLHAQALNLPTILDDMKKSSEPVAFSDSDFPPLKAEGAVLNQNGRGRKRGAWMGRKNFVRAGAPSPPPISTTLTPSSQLYDGVETPTSVAPHTPDLDSMVEPSPITSAFPITPRTPNGGYAPPSGGDDCRKDSMYASAPMFPPSFPVRRGSEDAGFENGPDGKELFVGGLEVTAWDEERVKSVFGRFGTIDELRFVRPGYHAPPHKRAFAFIKFTDQEAPQRAIGEEHLRIYDDRKIKVQLRETYPRRGGFRGRGRFHHGFLRTDRTSLDLDRDSSTGDALIGGTADEGHATDPEDTGHVRFASAPNMASANAEVDNEQETAQVDSPRVFEDALESISPVKETTEMEETEAEEPVVEEQETRRAEAEPVASSTSSCSDGAPDASMEAQPRSADTTITLADVAADAPVAQPAEEFQPEPDVLTNVSATPPPSNPEATSTYAPSSTGSAPTSTGYYPSTPSWIPQYAVPPVPYMHYGYYPQPVPGQPGTDATAYPWMAAMYRNAMPFVPWFNPPPGVELPTPPVRPTGYIQRDPGGIFIPVYPPERLGQYMSTSGAPIDRSQAQAQSAAAPSAGSWQNLPPHPQLYPVPLTAQQQQAMMMQQQQPQQQPSQIPMTGSGWITGPPPGTAYPAQHVPASAPPPYPAPNTYFPPQNSAAPAHNARQGVYGTYDGGMQQPQTKPSGRRGGDYAHQHRLSTNFGREGRPSPQRRGPGGGHGIHTGEQSFAGGAVDSQYGYAHMKANSALPAQLSMPPSTNGPEWNWNGQPR